MPEIWFPSDEGVNELELQRFKRTTVLSPLGRRAAKRRELRRESGK